MMCTALRNGLFPLVPFTALMGGHVNNKQKVRIIMNAEALKHATKVTPCQAIFYTWEELSNLYTALLSGYFERTIPVGVTADERGDGWFMRLWDAPLSSEELLELLDTIKADDYDREANDFGEYPIKELTQSVGNKIIALQLPFSIDASHAADEGIYFTGKMPTETVRLLVTYPELEERPDLLCVSIDTPEKKGSVINTYFDALRKWNADDKSEGYDRISKLRMVATCLEMELGMKVRILPIHAEGEIWG
ncbi:MAG: hypothetical protein RR502_08295 [Oscillospiraceae bacterium]